MEAWAPFAKGRNDLFGNPPLADIAEAHGKSVAQVVLRWLLQRSIAVVAKSAHRDRMEQNLDVFDFSLTEDEMGRIASLDTGTSCFFDHTAPAQPEAFAAMTRDV